MHGQFRFLVLLHVLICLVPSSSSGRVAVTMGQDHPYASSPCADSPTPVGWELVTLFLDTAASLASQDPDTPVIVVARLGNRERSQALNWKRLSTVRDYLQQGANLKNKLVLATGERTPGFGCIEVYLKGKLCFRFGVRKNGNVPVTDV